MKVSIVKPLYSKGAFHIFQAKIKEHSDEAKVGNVITCKGCVGSAIDKNMILELEGTPHWEKDRGEWQLKIIKAEVVIDGDKGLIAYLCREGKNIGERRAEELVALYGKNTIKVLEDEPERIAKDIMGMSIERANELSEWARSDRQSRDIKTQLYQLDCTPNMVAKIMAEYGSDAAKRLKEDPFCVADEIDGMGFKIASKIANAMGISGGDPIRIRAGVKYCLNKMMEEGGHTCVPQDALVTRCVEELEVHKNKVIEIIKELMIEEILLTNRSDPSQYSPFPELFTPDPS